MNGAVVWITGLPGSGKTTLAERVVERLRQEGGPPWVVLDGDAVRRALAPPPGYDEPGRAAFYETLARLAGLLAAQGVLVLVPATAHRRAYRARARALAPRFVEVWVRTPLAECERRDPKGLYAKARAGGIEGLPGAGAAYEPPLRPDVTAVDGRDEGAAEAVLALLREDRPRTGS